VNLDQGFLDWLAMKDPLSGIQRQALLDVAFAEHDAERTAALFNAFKDTRAPAITPPAPVPPNPDNLTKQVQPSSTPSSIQPTETVVKQWSPSEIEAHYRAVTKGEFKGREAEAARIEAEIDASLVRMGQPPK
jgi:hypothetical protein